MLGGFKLAAVQRPLLWFWPSVMCSWLFILSSSSFWQHFHHPRRALIFLPLTRRWSPLLKQTSAPRRRPVSPVSLMRSDWCCLQFVPDLRLHEFPGDSLTNWVLIQIANGSCHSEQADGQMESHGSQYVEDIVKSKVTHVFQRCSWCVWRVLIKAERPCN